jgi:hypothetical protein
MGPITDKVATAERLPQETKVDSAFSGRARHSCCPL